MKVLYEWIKEAGTSVFQLLAEVTEHQGLEAQDSLAVAGEPTCRAHSEVPSISSVG